MHYNVRRINLHSNHDSTHFLRWIFIFLLCALLPGFATADPGFQGKEAELQSLLDRYVSLGTPGVILKVSALDGTSWAGSSGFANLQTEKPMTPDLQFRMGSNTKSFTAALILQLQEEGKLTLDDTVDQWLPGLVPNGSNIRIRNLLNMTGGLFNYTTDESFVNQLESIVETGDIVTFTPDELVSIAIAHPPSFEPGNGWEYSNTNYILLGQIAQTVTGNDPADEIHNRFCEPLGLGDTFFNPGPSFTKDYVHGYIDMDDDGTLSDVNLYDPSIALTAGDGISTVRDMAVWLRALASGEFLSEASMNDLCDFVDIPMPPNDSVSIAYGTGIIQAVYNESLFGAPLTVLTHSGSIPGYWSEMYYYKDSSLTAAVMMNAEEDCVDTFFTDLTRVLYSSTSSVSNWEVMK